MTDMVLHRSHADLSLANLATVVEREHAEVVKALFEALQHALAAGDALLTAQTELTSESSFERWVEERGLHYRTAQNYMRLATYRDHLAASPEFQEMSTKRALLYLRGLPSRPKQTDDGQSEQAQEIKRLHREGIGSREIARMLGCSRSSVRWHTEPGYRERKTAQRTAQTKRRRDDERDTETVRRLEIRGGPLQEAHMTLARLEDTLSEAKDAAQSVDERRDIQHAIDSLTEAKHWLARAIRSDMDANRRPKVKHPEALRAVA